MIHFGNSLFRNEIPWDDLVVLTFSLGGASGGGTVGRACNDCGTALDVPGGGAASSWRLWTEDAEDNDCDSVSAEMREYSEQ